MRGHYKNPVPRRCAVCGRDFAAVARNVAATAFFSAKMDTLDFLREMRRLCDRAIREGGAE